MTCGRENYMRNVHRKQSGPSESELAYEEGRAVCQYENGKVRYVPKRSGNIIGQIKDRYRTQEK